MKKNFVIQFIVYFIELFVGLLCLSYAYDNLSAGWAFVLGVIYSQTVRFVKLVFER